MYMRYLKVVKKILFSSQIYYILSHALWVLVQKGKRQRILGLKKEKGKESGGKKVKGPRSLGLKKKKAKETVVKKKEKGKGVRG